MRGCPACQGARRPTPLQIAMPTPSPPRQPDIQPERHGAPLLRDLAGLHAEPLARALRDHLATGVPGGGHAFDAVAALWRARGRRAFAAWLCGVALALLRDTAGALAPAGSLPAPDPAATAATATIGMDIPRAPPPRLAAALSRAVPGELARPLLRLARSGLDAPDCMLFLCKPVNATENDIRIQK